MDRYSSGCTVLNRPVVILGQGVRYADGMRFLDAISVPMLFTWHGADMLASDHPMYFGRPGIYGQRAANFIMQNASDIFFAGTRAPIQLIGYDEKTFARQARLVHLQCLTNPLRGLVDLTASQEWLEYCNMCRKDFPWEYDLPKPTNSINSYQFVLDLQPMLHQDHIIVTDVGAAEFSSFQILPLTPPQRLITSGGLGEMGFALPAALGASIANQKRPVLCLNTDGAMMMNLQELQTIVHHQLNIKIIVFSNDGYGMIKRTQESIYEGRTAYVGRDSGVSLPNYVKLAHAFGIPAASAQTVHSSAESIRELFSIPGPALLEVQIDPDQKYCPKTQGHRNDDGSVTAPPLEDLWPWLPLETLRDHMLIPLTEASNALLR